LYAYNGVEKVVLNSDDDVSKKFEGCVFWKPKWGVYPAKPCWNDDDVKDCSMLL
jgi:hypothetical protein